MLDKPKQRINLGPPLIFCIGILSTFENQILLPSAISRSLSVSKNFAQHSAMLTLSTILNGKYNFDSDHYF